MDPRGPPPHQSAGGLRSRKVQGFFWVDTARRTAPPLLHTAAARGLSVITVRHAGKGENETLVDSARGSSAYGGEADTIVTIGRRGGQGQEKRRELRFVSRFEGLPDVLVAERLEDYSFHSLGTVVDVEEQETRHDLLEMLPEDEQRALAIDDVVETTGRSKSTVDRVLKQLRADGEVERRKGAGSASPKAFGYFLIMPVDKGG